MKIVAISQQKIYLSGKARRRKYFSKNIIQTRSPPATLKIQSARRLAPTDKPKMFFKKKELVVKPSVKVKGSLTSIKDIIARYTRNPKFWSALQTVSGECSVLSTQVI